MAKNYNSSENCHNASDKNTSNKNASRNTSNKNSYGKNAYDKNASNKNAYDKDAKDKNSYNYGNENSQLGKSFPDRTCKRTSCFGVYIRYSKTY